MHFFYIMHAFLSLLNYTPTMGVRILCVLTYVHICQEAILKLCVFCTSPHSQSSHMYGLHCLLVSVDIFARWCTKHW